MSAITTCVWQGATGTGYKFHVYNLPYSFKKGQPGNYIYCKIVNGYWCPVYIGEGDLRDRTANHHKANAIARKLATHIHAHINTDERSRLLEEEDLLAAHPGAYTPNGCNEQIGG